MQLGSASHIVIGSTDPAATSAFFAAFGFENELVRPGSMVRGKGHRTEIEIVEADQQTSTAAAGRLTGYDLGPRGLDLYSAGIERSVALAEAVAVDIGPIGVVEIGPMVMKQVTVWGPDGIPLVLIENSSRRASLLDTDPEALHSEIHSLVWAVADRDSEAQWWVEQGMAKGMDLSFNHPEVSSFMRLPDVDVDLSMVMLADTSNNPIRFEVLEFAGRDGAPFAPGGAGIQAVGFTVAGQQSRRLSSPGGVVVDIREAAAA